MAYVGTPTRYGDPVRSLASVLQGEAGSRAGQIAVANVIMNRADTNFSGYGSSVLDQAFARNQFQGQSAPTAQSLEIAQQTLNGSLERSLPGSLNYAAPVFSGPGATTAPWALRALNSGEGVNIGGNVFFNDSKGGTPNYTPGLSSTTNGNAVGTGTPGQTSGLTQNADGSYTFKMEADGTGSSTFPEIGAEAGANPAVAGGGSASATGRAASNSATSTSPQGQQTTSSNSSGGGGFAGGSMTVPQAIDTQTRGNASDTKSLNSQSQSNTEALNKTSTANTKSGIDAANTLYNSATGSLSDYFVRLIFIVVGIVALVGALMTFSKPKQLIQTVAKAAL